MSQRNSGYFGSGNFFYALISAVLLLVCVSQPAQSQTYIVIHNFTAKGTDGATPYGGPILDRSGNLYGTTYLGGRFGAGSVYKLSPSGSSWTYTSLYSLAAGADGSGPAFGTLAVHGGALFGTTEGGGSFGTAFRVAPSANGWRETVVHTFGNGTDGAQPIGGVVFDSSGNFYGTTSLGGVFGNGTVFEVSPLGIETEIYSFTGGNDGTNPPAGVTLDAQGNVYGTTSLGGIHGDGVVYELSPSASGWTQTVLYTFQGLNDGANPVGGVIVDKAGNLYGTTFDGGANGGGTVYRLSRSGGAWKMTILYSFTGGYGGPYNKLTFDSEGNLYGATNGEGAHGFGSVFKLTPASGSWTLTDLYDFNNGTDGGSPYGSVAVDTNGNIFGTAATGGSKNQGVVFEIMP
jgi:uncharacterized repeat protein (TIGR03803 family)